MAGPELLTGVWGGGVKEKEKAGREREKERKGKKGKEENEKSRGNEKKINGERKSNKLWIVV